MVTLPNIGGPFKVLRIDGELHVRRANNSEVITPLPLSNLPALLINGTNSADMVTLDASLDGVFRSIRFDAKGGVDKLDARLLSTGVIMDGGAGNDTLLGGSGDDQFFGGSEHDLAEGNGGRDWLVGDAGNDRLDGGTGDGDTVTGGLGNDVLAGDGGTDQLFGGAGSDSPSSVALPDTLSANGVFSDAAFTANLAALLSAFP